jgi:hypothetical protein
MEEAIFERVGILVRRHSFAWNYVQETVTMQKRRLRKERNYLTVHLTGFLYGENQFESSVKVYPSGEKPENNCEWFHETDWESFKWGRFTHIEWYIEEFAFFYKQLDYHPLNSVYVEDDSSKTNFTNGDDFFRRRDRWSMRIGTPIENLGVSFFSDVNPISDVQTKRRKIMNESKEE